MAINLQSLRKTSVVRPPRAVVYGTHGVGKSSFAAQAPNPVFIQTEEGLDALDVTAFPLARSYEEVMEAIHSLYSEDHEFKTVVLDSADWLEKLIFKQVAVNQKVANIEDIGYGKGYGFAVDLWHNVMEGFDLLRNEKGMGVIMLAHTQIKRYDDPLTDSYDRYMLDLHKGGASIISEWCDLLMFANYRVSTVKSDLGFNQKKTRAVGVGERMLYTQERPGWVAKSRWPLPDTLPLDYDAFSTALTTAMEPKGE
ncbi:AAA domain containing protein [uncultured Caudovirales phage]|uniref:AAA domain containing protein n=1 Tax=uncultured Caudovirales phage TaxID=2100421 RepID=A0A6J5PEI1_9CAUD|nr:AAA domain containing protein [uncultured Caudovirales phage]